jgi:DNA-binding transcriptional LysR family regulator
LDELPLSRSAKSTAWAKQVQAFCSQQNLDLQIVCHTAQLSTVQNCIALGLGVSLVPQALAELDTSGQIVYRALSDATPRRKIAAATYAGRTPSFLVERFVALVREGYPAG